MMRLALTLALVVATAAQAAGRFERFCSRTDEGRTHRGFICGDDFAFFEFAPLNGAGMTAECACTTPTGAKGETLTFTRTGAATCTRGTNGLRTTAIANGDVVVCASNDQPRVMQDANGVRGLPVEGARTNINPRSEEFENAAYTLTGTGAAAPSTPTANTATAPSGAVTADTVTFNATTAGQNSLLRAVVGGACSAAQCAYSVYVRGVSGSGTVDMGAWGSTVSTAPCAYVDTSWTRCVVTATIAGTPGIFVGNTTANNGGTDRPTQSIYVWGGQQELGAFASSYIPTTSAAVTRNAEAASFTLPVAFSSASGMSWAAAVTHPSGNGGGVWAAGPAMIQDATNRTQLFRTNTNVQQCDYLSTAGSRSVGPVISAYVAGQLYRQACDYSGAGASSTISGYRDGVLTATSAAGTTGAITVATVLPCALGAAATTGPADGICTRVCLGVSGACR